MANQKENRGILEIQFQTPKEMNFLHYLKTYCSKTLRLLRKIEDQFHLKSIDDAFFSSMYMMDKVKNLFASYEIMIVELSQYCELIGIEDLGKCMLKIYLQNMSIVEWILKNFLELMEKQERTKSKSNEVDSESKKNNHDPNQYYKIRQNNRFIASQLSGEIDRIEEKEFSHSNEKNKEDIQNIKKMKEKVMNIQSSQTEVTITETVQLLQKKGRNLEAFTEMNDLKNQHVIDKKFQFEANSQQKVEKGIKKLKQLFQLYYADMKKKEKKEKSHQYCQTDIEKKQFINEGNDDKKKIEENKKLTHELLLEKQKYQTLEKLLREKESQYQTSVLNLKMEKIYVQKKNQNQRRKTWSKPERKNNSIQTQQVINLEIISTTKNESQLIDSELIEQKISQNKLKRSTKKEKIQNRSSIFQKSRRISKFDTRKSLKNQDKYTLLISSREIQFFYRPQSIRKQEKLLNPNILRPSSQSLLQDSVSSRSYRRKKKNACKDFSRSYQLTILPSSSQENKQYFESFLESKGFKGSKRKSTVNSTEKRKKKSLSISKEKQSIKSSKQPIMIQALFSANDKQDEKKLQLSSFSYQQRQMKNNLVRSLDISNSPTKSKIKSKLPQHILKFTNHDLENLFLEGKKAVDYEFINYNLGLHRKKIEPSESTKLTKYLTTKSYSRFIPGKNQRVNSTSLLKNLISENLLNCMIKHFRIMKQSSPKNYESIRNFLRFPHSVIHFGGDPRWRTYGKNEKQLGIGEIRKLLNRLNRIHENCPTSKSSKDCFCEHMKNFFNKIGIFFQ